MNEIIMTLCFLFSFAVNIVFAYIIYDRSKTIGRLHKDWDEIINENINNLFYECKFVSSKLIGGYRRRSYYQGIIKTLLSDGTEKIVWKSEKDNLDFGDCTKLCKHRLEILKKYYNIEQEHDIDNAFI